MKSKRNFGRTPSRFQAGMTLMEVVISLAISGMAVGGIVTGYIFCTSSAERAALSLTASARAMERIEETRSAKWDTSSWPPVDQVVATNFLDKTVTLDLSGSGAAVTSATIQTAITQIPGAYPLKRIHVDCIWTFKRSKGSQLVTNSIETFRAPDQ